MTAGGAAFLLLVAGLATARTTRLITTDEITRPLRRLAHRADPRARHVGYLVACPYCSGVWAAIGVLGLMLVASEVDGWERWLAAAPVAIMAVAQAGLWLTPREPNGNGSYTAPWPKGG